MTNAEEPLSSILIRGAQRPEDWGKFRVARGEVLATLICQCGFRSNILTMMATPTQLRLIAASHICNDSNSLPNSS